ncbi:MAG: 1,4-alpha-glucan branching protein GlgB [Lachnospiraceae bacterium]|nr:1,4-alpha-glucan branching protein GlgB [Lachnospiraceae bacterium]
MDKKLYKLMNWPLIEEIVYSESSDPHRILGTQKAGNSTLVQAFFPGASEVYLQWTVKEKDKITGKSAVYAYDAKMELADEVGFFAVLVAAKKLDSYRFHVIYEDGTDKIVEDPYRFAPIITEDDVDRFQNGIHYEIYEKLGAHPMTIDGVDGVLFAVWAPNCMRVSIVGDFNNWDGRIHQMRRLYDSGIFEIFLPGVAIGSNYKFEIKLKSGITFLKADPYGNAAQLRPDTASVVTDLSDVRWEDAAFLKNRKSFQTGEVPMSVYEVYLGSVMERGEDESYPNYREIAPKLIDYVKKMGYTHVELMPVMEHPYDESWGYQVIGYYAPTARYGSPADFMYLINELHKAGIGVILDWVPAHFPKDEQGLSCFDGTCLYEHQDPRKGVHPHWGTLLFNYGRPEVSNYLIANALFWVEKYHADGIRMDAVASMLYLDYGRAEGEWIPNIYGGKENLEAIEMIKHLNSIMKKRNPGVLTIAEESTAFPLITGDLQEDGLGFDLKWNMGFMNDYLDYIKYDPYFRAHHHGELTFSMIYAYTEKFMLVFSHDEVVHGKSSMLGKMPGMREQKFANLRISYAYMMTHPGKKLLFMGQDLGEFDEWNEKRAVEWNLLEYPGHRGLNKLVKALNGIYKEQKALYELDDEIEGFEWINNISANECYLSYARHGKKTEDLLLVVANFSGVERQITTGVPIPGKYKEILNTDSKEFDGSNLVNAKPISSKEIEWDTRPESITVKLAPLSMSILKFVPFTKADLKRREEEKALIQAKEALRLSEEAQKQAQEAADEASRRAEMLAKEAKEAKLAAKHAMESLEKAKHQTTDALAQVQSETEKLENMKGKKED